MTRQGPGLIASILWKDIEAPIADLSRKMGFSDVSYVNEILATPDRLTVTAFRGRDGRCKGPKYVDAYGNAATEQVTRKVRL